MSSAGEATAGLLADKNAEIALLRAELAAVNTHADGIMKEALRWKDERDAFRAELAAEWIKVADYNAAVIRAIERKKSVEAENARLRAELAAVNAHADGIMKEALRWKDERDALCAVLDAVESALRDRVWSPMMRVNNALAAIDAVLAKGGENE